MWHEYKNRDKFLVRNISMWTTSKKDLNSYYNEYERSELLRCDTM